MGPRRSKLSGLAQLVRYITPQLLVDLDFELRRFFPTLLLPSLRVCAHASCDMCRRPTGYLCSGVPWLAPFTRMIVLRLCPGQPFVRHNCPLLFPPHLKCPPLAAFCSRDSPSLNDLFTFPLPFSLPPLLSPSAAHRANLLYLRHRRRESYFVHPEVAFAAAIVLEVL